MGAGGNGEGGGGGGGEGGDGGGEGAAGDGNGAEVAQYRKFWLGARTNLYRYVVLKPPL